MNSGLQRKEEAHEEDQDSCFDSVKVYEPVCVFHTRMVWSREDDARSGVTRHDDVPLVVAFVVWTSASPSPSPALSSFSASSVLTSSSSSAIAHM